MNVSELARKLRIMPNDLREKLSRLGFDIGKKAIKIDDKTAIKIIKDWPILIQQLNKIDEEAKEIEKTQQAPQEKIAKLPKRLTIKNLSQLLQIPLPKLMLNLMNNSILLSANEYIDFTTASIIAEDFNVKTILEDTTQNDEQQNTIDIEKKIKTRLANVPKECLYIRPPIIVIVGHVDHGKTTLLDKIRETNIVNKEAGHITQHIGAYQIVKKDKQLTFIDTPGHEIFTSIRSRGARVADVAILVIAADDGIQEQTKEAVKLVQAAKLPIIVAINKIDKPSANIELVKSNLTGLNLIPEDFGGTTICVPISAKTGSGIDNLLDTILLVADMQKDQLWTDNTENAIGTIIDSHVSQKEGVLATVLIRSGVLKINDFIVINNVVYGKSRSLKNFLNEPVKTAVPSMPVKILGLKSCPAVGSIIEVVPEDKAIQLEKPKKITHQAQELHKISWTQPVKETSSDTVNEEAEQSILNVILKTDMSGSQEAIITGLENFNEKKQRIKIISSGLGHIIETDLMQARACNAVIVGFNVNIKPTIIKTIEDEKIDVKTYNVIYALLDDIKKKLIAMSDQEIQQIIVGEINVKKIFITEKNYTLFGGIVLNGKITNNLKCNIERNNKIIDHGTIINIRVNKENIALITEGEECGIKIKTRQPILVGDIIKPYQEKQVEEII